MTLRWPDKDPNETLDYACVWTPRDLGSDTITSTTATVKRGVITVSSHVVQDLPKYKTGQVTVTWLAGGTAGSTVEILLHITTATGRQMDQTVLIDIKER